MTWRMARSERSAHAGTAARTASLTLRAPSEPVNTATTVRSSGRPRASRAGARSATRSMARTSGRTGLPVTTLRGRSVLGERHGRGLGEAARQAVGRTGAGVLLGDHDRHPPEHGADHAGDAGVAAEHQHDRRAAAPHQADALDHGPQQAQDGADVLEGEAALDAPAGQHGETEAGLGHERGLEAALAADEVDGGGVVAAGDQGAGDGEAGEHVAGGAAAGHQGVGAGLAG